MERDILAAIVAVEKEIGERLAAEQRRAEEGLAQLKGEMEDEVNRAEGELGQALQDAVVAARADAEAKAAHLLDKEAAWAELLARLDDSTLEGIIERHLNRILPGRGDDRQNVQG